MRAYPGNRFLVVYDRDDPDPLGLEAACHAARTLVIAGASHQQTEIDAEYMSQQIERILATVEDAKTIRRGINGGREGLDTIEKTYGTPRDVTRPTALSRSGRRKVASLRDVAIAGDTALGDDRSQLLRGGAGRGLASECFGSIGREFAQHLPRLIGELTPRPTFARRCQEAVLHPRLADQFRDGLLGVVESVAESRCLSGLADRLDVSLGEPRELQLTLGLGSAPRRVAALGQVLVFLCVLGAYGLCGGVAR